MSSGCWLVFSFPGVKLLDGRTVWVKYETGGGWGWRFICCILDLSSGSFVSLPLGGMVTLGAAKWGSCANICVGVKVEEYLEWNFHGLPLTVVLIASCGLRT